MSAVVGFIGDDNDFLQRSQLGHRLALFRHEFVNRREHHASDRSVQQFAQILAPAGLHRRLAEDRRSEPRGLPSVRVSQSPPLNFHYKMAVICDPSIGH